MAGSSRHPVKAVVVKPSYRCDQACVMCPHPVGRRGGSTMSLAAIDENLGIVAARYLPGRLELVGGEPLLHPDLSAIVAACARHLPDVPRHVYTNGCQLAREPVAGCLVDHDVTAEVSVHGADEASSRAITRRRGQVERLRRGLDRAASMGIRLRAHVAVVRQNEERLGEIVALIADYPFEAVRFRFPILAAPRPEAYKPDASAFVTRVRAALDALPKTMDACVIMAPLCFGRDIPLSDEPGDVVLIDQWNQLGAERRRSRYENAIIDGFGESRFTKPASPCASCDRAGACGGIDGAYLPDFESSGGFARAVGGVP